MHLAPREIDKLLLHQVGFLAQKRLARGVHLNHPEAVALIATVILEMIRDGDRTVAELMDVGRQLLGRNQVMPGVADLIADVQVEGTFPDGSKLVTVHHPIAREDGDLRLALFGSFLPVPPLSIFARPSRGVIAEPITPGEVTTLPGEIILNAGRKALALSVTNLGDRPVQVGSHYHFGETNAALKFDREQAYGMRLDIPAGTAVRFEPGDTKTINLVQIAGEEIILGGNNLADGPLTEAGRQSALTRAIAEGFAHAPEGTP